MKMTLTGKDPDLMWQDETATDADRDAIKQFLEFSEYFSVEIDVDPQTGEGTVKMMRMRS